MRTTQEKGLRVDILGAAPKESFPALLGPTRCLPRPAPFTGHLKSRSYDNTWLSYWRKSKCHLFFTHFQYSCRLFNYRPVRIFHGEIQRVAVRINLYLSDPPLGLILKQLLDLELSAGSHRFSSRLTVLPLDRVVCPSQHLIDIQSPTFSFSAFGRESSWLEVAAKKRINCSTAYVQSAFAGDI